jgi:hypothetical protein
MTQFDEPDPTGTSGPRLYPADLIGHLLIVWAVEYIDHSPTQYTKPGQNADVIVVDVVDLSQNDEETGELGLVARRCWWRQGRLIQALRGKVGSPTPKLVLMTKGTGGMGRSAPYELQSMTSDRRAVQVADDWFNKHPDFKISQPYQAPQQEPAQTQESGWIAAQREKLAAKAQQQQAATLWEPPQQQETQLESMARMASQGGYLPHGEGLPPRKPPNDDDDAPF